MIQESNDQNLKDKPIDGVFLEKIIGSNGRFYNYLDPEEDDLTCLKYDGAFLNDYDSMLKFDHTLNEPGAKSKYVYGLMLTKNYGLMLTKKMAISRLGAGQYHALSRQELDNFALIVDKNFNECVEKIAFGSFHIQPYKTSIFNHIERVRNLSPVLFVIIQIYVLNEIKLRRMSNGWK